MARIDVWTGDEEMAAEVATAIGEWDPDEEVARRVIVEVDDKGEAHVMATFTTKGDGQDAAAWADGFVIGFHKGAKTAPPDTETDDPDDDEDLEETEEEEEET